MEKDELREYNVHFQYTFDQFIKFFGHLDTKEECSDFLYFIYHSSMKEYLENGKLSVFFNYTMENMTDIFGNLDTNDECAEFIYFVYSTKLSIFLSSLKFNRFQMFLANKLNKLVTNVSDPVRFGNFFRTQGHVPYNQFQIDEFNMAWEK